MKYFTPDLYLRLNSSDDGVAETAHERWEEAIVEYKSHLSAVSSRLKPSTRHLAKSLCLHDAHFLGMTLSQLPGSDNSLAILSTKQESKSVLLIYVLVEEPLIQEVNGNTTWPFSKEHVCCLYDEFDVSAEGIQQHEVLLSNGRILTFRFDEMEQIEHFNRIPSQVA